jgi:glycosyltransferase involved in cell wall biosynthesis
MDVERIPIRAVLQQLLDEREDVIVASLGLGLGLHSARYHAIPQLPLHELPGLVAQFDIGIAPIADLEFNRSRSNVKLKEYAATGTPWLASPIGPYVDHGEQQGGRLVADDEWHAALTRLIDKPRERQKLAKRARRWGATQTIGQHAADWEARFEQAIARARATSSG